MKLKQLLFISLFLFITPLLKAQANLKIGHVNIQELVQKHPAADSISKVLETETKEMESLYNEMIVEHESKRILFEKEKSGYSEFVYNSKENELIEMAQKIQEFSKNAQMQLQNRNMELLQPIYQQINTAIKRIADKELFTYVLDLSNGAVAYVSTDSQDLNPSVMERLGITNTQNH